MRIFKDTSIRQQLIRISLLTAGFALILSAAFLIIEEVMATKAAILKEFAVQTEIIGNNSTAALSFNDAKAGKEILSALRANENIEFAAIYAKDGTLFAEYSPRINQHNMTRLLNKEGHRFGLNYLAVFHDIVLDKEVVGSIYIQTNLDEVHRGIFQLIAAFIAAIMLSLFAAYLFSLRMQKTITGPISELVRTIKTISGEKDYSVRSTIQRRDELGTLSEGFNEMLEQIQSRDIELESHRSKLSLLVDKRTEELKDANEQLQKELTERRRAEEEISKLNRELETKVRKRTQQLLEAQEELVRKEKLSILGQLSGSVGHELRNPLGVISNAVYFLKAVMPEADETVREYLDLIKNEVNNSERIISDLLDFARTKTPQIKEVTARELITNGLGKCSVPENIVLTLDVPEELPAVAADPLQMEQVFQNLIMNAVQAMPGGGALRINATTVKSPTRDGHFVEVSVTDTGEGISPENMKKLFQPLFTTKAKGIGLGLVVSKRFAEANGGKIDVQSEVGEGTTFKLIFPIAKGDGG